MLPRPNPKGSGYKNKARLRGLNCILDLHPQQRNKGTMPEPPRLRGLNCILDLHPQQRTKKETKQL